MPQIGCGWTTTDVVRAVKAKAVVRYKHGLERPNLADRYLLATGFRAGFEAAVQHLTEMGVITVLQDPPE